MRSSLRPTDGPVWPVRFARVGLGGSLAVLAVLAAGGCPLQGNVLGSLFGLIVDVDPAPFANDKPASENEAPVVELEDGIAAMAGDTVVLDGRGVTDANHDRLTFWWRQVGGTPQVAVSQPFSSVATFTAPSDAAEPIILTFELIVADGLVAVSDTVDVTVSPAQ